MKKDGLAEKVQRDLKQLYDPIIYERIPDDLRALVERLK